MTQHKLILASNSPRRREMLAWTGWEFAIQPAHADETPHPDEAPDAYVLRLAAVKAKGVAQTCGDGFVLAADTTVADGRELMGKPASAAEARRMLGQLRGRTHYVFTALGLFDLHRGSLSTALCTSPVKMREYSDEDIEAYIASGDPFDKAGAYAIQHTGFHPAENFDHCFANVMGLPLCTLARLSRACGFPPLQDIPSACQGNLSYTCSVYNSLLNADDE
jgi:septum formation protein